MGKYLANPQSDYVARELAANLTYEVKPVISAAHSPITCSSARSDYCSCRILAVTKQIIMQDIYLILLNIFFEFFQCFQLRGNSCGAGAIIFWRQNKSLCF